MQQSNPSCFCRQTNPHIVEETQSQIKNQTLFDEMANFYKIMGDSTRLKIIFALMQSELCVNDIATMLEMTKSSISHQLKKMRMAKIVKNRKVGKEVYYCLDDHHMVEIYKLTQIHLSHGNEA